jgi:hypothetical protein
MSSEAELGGWTVSVTRPADTVAMFEVSLSGYREFFLVVEGSRTVAITMFEPGTDAFPEPQVFVFAKPYGWRRDLDDDEALMQIWQAVGVQR